MMPKHLIFGPICIALFPVFPQTQTEFRIFDSNLRWKSTEDFAQRYCNPRHGNTNNSSKSYVTPQCAVHVEDLLKGVFRDGTVPRDSSLFPPWVNMSLAVRGQQFAMDHMYSTSVSLVFGLNLLLALPQISQPIFLTQNSNTKRTSSKRYAATITQVFLWFRRALDNSEDLKGNVEQLNWTLESVRNVRFLHLKAAAKVNSIYSGETNTTAESISPLDVPFWDAFQKDLEASHIPQHLRVLPQSHLQDSTAVPLNQFSFSMTQFAFLFMTLRPSEVGIEKSVTNDDLMSYAYLWAVLGYALGIEDDFNVALQPDLPSLQEYFENLLNSYFIPHLFNLSFPSKVLIQALSQASTALFTGVEPDFYLRQSLKRILKIPTPHLDARRSVLGIKSDKLWELEQTSTSLFPPLIPISSPLFSLYHFKIGFQFFGHLYSSDESIAKNCFFFQS